MNTRSAGATALQLLLLMASLLDAAGCELLCFDEPDSSSKTVQIPGSKAQTGPVDEEHDEDCPCCGLCVPRVLFEPSTSTDPTLAVAEVAPTQRGVFFTKAFTATHLSRGPPASGFLQSL